MNTTPTPNRGGWLKLVSTSDWHAASLDEYPGWEIEREGTPAFVRLSHVDGQPGSSRELCVAWDDVATVGFYQRDWTESGMPWVSDGETYWSGWWFQTMPERDRFLAWVGERRKK